MRASIVTVLAALAAAGLAGRAAGAPAGVVSCGSLSLGPASLVTHRSGGGATCLLSAFRRHCSTARYTLSVFGVDTIATRTFTVVARAGRCEVQVASSFRVVPQRPHANGVGYCRTLRQAGAAVTAADCAGGALPATISLTSAR